MSAEISHEGIIKHIAEDTIIVSIINKSACSACHAKSACMASDMKDKEIEVPRGEMQVIVGQRVNIVGKTTQGFLALLYGYMIPFAILLIFIIVLTSLDFSEATSALVALGALVPYYFILYFLRDKLKKAFKFELKSIL